MKIKRLTLFTKNLEEQQYFYGNTLGLEEAGETATSICFRVGASLLCFEENRNATPYHFAFNIPSFTENEALAWLRERADILTDHGNEIQDFKSWNAKSLYFYDADKNIVEFISRRNLGYAAEEAFGPKSFREISELGLAVEDIRPFYNLLKEIIGLEIYDGQPDHFCAIGNEHGLLICIDLSTKTWYPTGDKAYASEFELLLSEKNKEYILTYFNHELKISKLYE